MTFTCESDVTAAVVMGNVTEVCPRPRIDTGSRLIAGDPSPLGHLGGRELPEFAPGRRLLAGAPLRAGNWNPRPP
jgi:hypothetical protein